MNDLLYYVCVPLGVLMKWCWQLVGNYGVAILLFTLATKVVLLPLSVWIHKNSIQMVEIQPDINFLKAKYYGNGDMIAEEQAKLFKKHHYHPMLSLIPLAVQLFLLMGVVYIIYRPLGYLFGTEADVIRSLIDFVGANAEDSAAQISVVEAIRAGRLTASSVVPGVDGAALAEVVEAVSNFDISFLAFDLSVTPTVAWGFYILVPVIAGASSYLLCFTQNLANVIQHEQGKLSQWGLTILSVGISLYLGCFVPAGTALYWVASNLFSIVQMYALNAVINPKKYVDYDALEKSRKALADIEALESKDKKDAHYRENKARERADYKRFFKVVGKHIVFYSEKSGFYKYFRALIDELLSRSNITIHYVTNDPDDVIFEVAKNEPRIRPYYIGLKKMIPLMMMMEADIMVMTTPDLNKFYLKRSVIDKKLEYVYIPHDMMSMHMSFREGAWDAFDTVFCAGPHIAREVRATEKVYGLPEKKLVEFGYPLSDMLVEAGEEARKNYMPRERKEILIAPSWQEDNLLDSCIDALIEGLYSEEYHITVRPHPEYVKRYRPRMDEIVARYADRVGEGLTFELDFSKNTSLYSSDLIITDWSGVAPEFCFATHRPALFVNTKMKCMNPNWEKIGLTPVEISLRSELGMALDKEELVHVKETVADLIARTPEYDAVIAAKFDEMVYNHGTAAAVGAKYLLSSLVEKQKAKKK